MANLSLNQLVDLKQPASDYISQCEKISSHIKDLIEALKMLLSSFQETITSANSSINRYLIPVGDLEVLNIHQIQATEILKKAVDAISIYDGFSTYSKALAKTFGVYKEDHIGYDKNLSSKGACNAKNKGDKDE